MKLGLIFAACLLVAGCGAAASVDATGTSNTVDSGAGSSGDDSATGTSSGDDGGSVTPPGNDAGSSGGDDGGTTTSDGGSSGDDGGSSTTDSGSSGGDDGSSTADSGSGGDDGGTPSTDSGSGGGDDGGVTNTDSGSGGSADSGSGGSQDSGSGGPGTDSGSGGGEDSGSCQAHSCVYTQGYYKTHTSNWTVLPVIMGTNSYSEAQCLTLLNDPSTGDASVILAKQYIAAVENGGLCDPNASALMAQAEQWFTDNQNGTLPYGTALPMAGCASDHSSVPCQAYWLGQALDSYNNGLSGTPACQ